MSNNLKTKKLKKTLKMANTVSYRKKKTFKTSNKILNLTKGENFINKDSNNNEYLVPCKVISNPNLTGSNSFVILLKPNEKIKNDLIDEDNRYVIKITMPNYKTISQFTNEVEIYDVVNLLVDNYITPHIFKKIENTNLSNMNELDSKTGEDFNKSINLKNLINTEIKKKKKFLSTSIGLILNETNIKGKDIKPLSIFLIYLENKNINISIKTKIYKHILFQIIYTLEAFNLINLKHNDLHLGNIFIIIDDKNIIKQNLKDNNSDNYYSEYNREYEFYNTKNKLINLKIPNIGIHVRIFDFDRSIKQKNNFYLYKDEIKDYQGMYFQDQENNKFYDIFNIINFFDLFKKHYKRYPLGIQNTQIQNIIKSFYKNEEFLKPEHYITWTDLKKMPKENINKTNLIKMKKFVVIQDEKIKFLSQLILGEDLAKDYLLTTTELLEKFYDLNEDNDKPTIQKYSLKYINEPIPRNMPTSLNLLNSNNKKTKEILSLLNQIKLNSSKLKPLFNDTTKYKNINKLEIVKIFFENIIKIKSKKIIVFDFDQCLMKSHLWSKYRNNKLEDIKIVPDDFGHSNITDLFKRIIEKGMYISIASFGRKDLITRTVNESIFNNDKEFNVIGINSDEDLLKNNKNIIVTTPQDYKLFSNKLVDGSGRLGNKNTQLTKIKDLYKTEFSNIVFFDDDNRNIKKAQELGIKAIHAKPFNENHEKYIFNN